MNPLRRALFLTLLSSNSSTLLYFVSSLAIARLLSPAQIGVFAVASVLVGVAQILREFAVGSYIVRERDLTPERLGAAFGLLMTVSWVMAAAVYFVSIPAEALYRESGIRDVLQVLALNFVLVPFGAITVALLKRDLRFGARGKIEVASAAVSVATAVTLASNGMGYMSLAWASVAAMAMSVIGSQFYRSPLLPRLPSLRDGLHVFSFGFFASGAQLGTVLNQSAPELILGRFQDMHSVGVFSRAGGLVRIFSSVMVQAFANVALPHFSGRQEDKEGLKESYLRFVEVITGAAWPFLATLAIAAAPVTLLFFGDQWGESIPLVPILCLAAALTLPFSMTAAVLVASGRPESAFRLEWLSLALRAPTLVVLAPLGLQACAWGQVVVSAAMASVYTFQLFRHNGIGLPSLLRAAGRSVFLTFPCAVLAAMADQTVAASGLGVIAHLCVVGGAALLGYTIALLVVNHPLGREMRRRIRRS